MAGFLDRFRKSKKHDIPVVPDKPIKDVEVPAVLQKYHASGSVLARLLNPGRTPCAFWPLQELLDYNKAYKVFLDAPGYFGFASTEDGRMFAFSPVGGIVCMPFIPMRPHQAKEIAGNWQDFEGMLVEAEPSAPLQNFWASPPVPDWTPDIEQPLDQIEDRVRYYTSNKVDFAIFQNGTFVLLQDGLSDREAEEVALLSLAEVLHAHPDMWPMDMDDGNTLVRYKGPVANVVLRNVVEAHFQEIERNHRRTLAPTEAIINGNGVDVFDNGLKTALFGRCYMFMDAKAPAIVRILRKPA